MTDDEIAEASREMRRAVEEAGEEMRRAGAELRVELGMADKEFRRSLHVTMDDVRAALRAAFGAATAAEEREVPAAATRMSRAERKELTRELLLDAAIEVFAQKGYHGASLDDVAEAAGFTKGAVYSNFTRKSDLFLELVARESSRRGAAIQRAVSAVDLAVLPELLGEWLSRQSAEAQDWDVLTVEFWLAAVRDASVRRALCAGREESLAQLGTIIDSKLADAGARPGLSGRELAAIIDALGAGLLMTQAIDPESGSAGLFAQAVRKLLADVVEPGSPGSAQP